MEFLRDLPEETSIPSHSISTLTDRLTSQNLSLHSLLILHRDRLIAESYFPPYGASSLHRMYSITKSFTAIAIGLLLDEGRLSLDDSIITYFPDKLPEKTNPWIAAMTIRDMLMMRSCHSSTTYKRNPDSDWVESFFTTPPTHPAGTVFHYDTSASHTLCALAERLTKTDMLSYIRSKLPSLGLSEDAYLLKDPFGVSMGGTGLIAYPMDLLKFGYFIEKKGQLAGKQLLSSSYISLITSHLSDTSESASFPFEAGGYGMQFWRLDPDSYMCYGLGGQFILFYPKHDLICVTTADAPTKKATQEILHVISDTLLPCINPCFPDGAAI